MRVSAKVNHYTSTEFRYFVNKTSVYSTDRGVIKLGFIRSKIEPLNYTKDLKNSRQAGEKLALKKILGTMATLQRTTQQHVHVIMQAII